jgi:hypothetical protein
LFPRYSKLRKALLAVLVTLKASDPLIVDMSPAELCMRLEQAPSLFRDSAAWFAKLGVLSFKDAPLNQHGQELAERMKIGVKGALTALKERVRPNDGKEKPGLGGLDDDSDDEELEERAEAM